MTTSEAMCHLCDKSVGFTRDILGSPYDIEEWTADIPPGVVVRAKAEWESATILYAHEACVDEKRRRDEATIAADAARRTAIKACTHPPEAWKDNVCVCGAKRRVEIY